MTKITELLKRHGWTEDDLRKDPIGGANVKVVHIRLEERCPRVDVLEPGRKYASAAERNARRVEVQKLLPAGMKIRLVDGGVLFEGTVEYSPEGMGYMRVRPDADFQSPREIIASLIGIDAEVDK